MQCGVGQFTRLLGETIEKLDPGSSTTLTLTRSEGSVAEIWRATGSARNLVCNFPIVAWKRVMFRPLLAMAIARLRGRRTILIQHEWAGLHRLRRITYIPALLLADTIVMFSPLVRRELADDPVVGWTARKCVLAPLPPNIEAPAGIADSKLRQRLAAAREAGRLVIGHFGSIYPGKQPNALLNISAILKERGLKPLLVYIGSFIRGVDKVEEEFHARAAELGISDDVIVSGYVASDHEVFGLFSQIDAFCYPLEEGLTARRGSVVTCVQSGRPSSLPARPNRTSSTIIPLQGIDRSRRHRAGRARCRRSRLCRPDRIGAEMAVGSGAVRFRWLVARCGAGGTRAVRHARRRNARRIMQAGRARQLNAAVISASGSGITPNRRL